jgi:hypothetical protein
VNGTTRVGALLAIAALLVLCLASGCGGDSGPEAVTPTESPSDTATETGPETTTGEGTVEQPFEDFDKSNFDDPTTIDNDWNPVQPGTRYVYEGVTKEGGEAIPHRVVVTVTDLTKVIDGVRTVVSWDQDFSAGEVVEAEIAFFAQDNDGNVWRMGEYPEEYEEGKVVDAPAWIAGAQNAKAGILIKAEPERGSSYSQGWAPAVEFTDRTQVYKTNQRTCVPVDCYQDVLVMEEFSLAEPNAFQLKYYGRGVGNVRVGWRGEDATREVLELVKVQQLGPSALAKARAEALKLEQHAYETSQDVYGGTPPSQAAGA